MPYFSLFLVLGIGSWSSLAFAQTQDMRMQASCGGTPVSGVTCVLTNDKGTVQVTTPGVAQVPASTEDLAITCSKGTSVSSGSFQSRRAGGLWGKLNSWGGFQQAQEVRSFEGLDYPPSLIVEMPQPCPAQ